MENVKAAPVESTAHCIELVRMKVWHAKYVLVVCINRKTRVQPVTFVLVGGTKRMMSSNFVYSVSQETIKIKRARQFAKNVAKDNIKINPVMKLVWIVKWVGT